MTDKLTAALKEIYEIWAGSEGIPLPKTAPEAYLLGLIEQMRDVARDALNPAPAHCDCFMQRNQILVDRSVVQQALHMAMAAEHPVRLIAALRKALEND